MEAPPETGFTLRIRKVCADAARVLPAQSTSRMIALLDRCGGDFASTARLLLEGPMPLSLLALARAGMLELSLEWVVANEPEWTDLFGDRHREIAGLRLNAARQFAAEDLAEP